jgi:lysozyme
LDLNSTEKDIPMKMTEEGLALIREAEGFRGRAYRDAVGVWTIGFGHTSAAGAPVVREGDVIARERGEEILARDVNVFADGVEKLVKPVLSGAQFSALVSFAYNVGLRNFKSSGVLAAVNAHDFAAVPRRLALWNKAGGRVLPGLVKRRAAEAALFMKGNLVAAPAPVDVPMGRPAAQSTTIWAAASIAVIAFFNELARYLGYGVLGVALAAVIVAGALWIIRERRRKSQLEGV